MSNIAKILKETIFRKDVLKRFIYAFKACVQFQGLYPLGRYSNVNIDVCVENYINNMETAKYYTDMLSARYLNFLQPFNGGGRAKLSKFDVQSVAHIRRRLTYNGDNELDLIMHFYNRLWKKVKAKGYVFDLRDLFENYDGEIYFDQAHCSDIGYDRIAKEIADKIIKMERNISRDKQAEEKGLQK